jgi:hypothetical protein
LRDAGVFAIPFDINVFPVLIMESPEVRAAGPLTKPGRKVVVTFPPDEG